jgi:hypothetical protein
MFSSLGWGRLVLCRRGRSTDPPRKPPWLAFLGRCGVASPFGLSEQHIAGGLIQVFGIVCLMYGGLNRASCRRPNGDFGETQSCSADSSTKGREEMKGKRVKLSSEGAPSNVSRA